MELETRFAKDWQTDESRLVEDYVEHAGEKVIVEKHGDHRGEAGKGMGEEEEEEGEGARQGNEGANIDEP